MGNIMIVAEHSTASQCHCDS